LENQKVNLVLVVDPDVYQGFGTAESFKNRMDVFTFSMHGEKNYPHRKEKLHLNIGLADGIGDREYSEKVTSNHHLLLEEFSPDFIIYQCGVDVLSSDQLGKLNLSQNV
jgi:acetoin utilization deacetylase AcuC-like enzyme